MQKPCAKVTLLKTKEDQRESNTLGLDIVKLNIKYNTSNFLFNKFKNKSVPASLYLNLSTIKFSIK